MLLGFIHFRYLPPIPSIACWVLCFNHLTLYKFSKQTCKAWSVFVYRCPVLSVYFDLGHDGSPEFPSYPFKYMPCSKTPVVSQTLAMTCLRLLRSDTYTPSAFPVFISLVIIYDHNYTIFRGSIRSLFSRSTLAPHTLLPRSHPGFTTHLLAKLWLGRIRKC